MEICGLQKNTLIDYPGRIACTVFLCGCNFQCPWCYSRELVLLAEIQRQPKIPQKEFFDFLEERRGLLEGAVICGGEPTLNKDLPEFIKKIKKSGFLVKLDTNGSNPEMLKKLIDEKLIDYVAMDIKAPPGAKIPNPKSQIPNKFKIQNSKSKYEKATGVRIDLSEIQKSIEIIKKSGIDYEFRTTVVPGIHTKEDIIKIAEWIGGKNVKYYLQNFRPEKTIDPKLEKLKPYPEEYLLEIQKVISPFFEICQVR